MGVDYVLFDQLCQLSGRFRPEGRTLMLGRHAFKPNGRFSRLYERSWRRAGKEGSFQQTVQEDGFCETLMEKLGFGQMEAMDFSDYEGAGILHDLNRPVAAELEGQFDFIFDGGTLEHVFNVPVALQSVFRMLKPGGRFVSANGMNGWLAHGIYQFSPELVWTFWGRTAGCQVHRCLGLRTVPEKGAQPFVFPDPALKGNRLRLGKTDFPKDRVYLYYEVERLAESSLGDIMLQSDYVKKWAPHSTAGALQETKAKEA